MIFNIIYFIVGLFEHRPHNKKTFRGKSVVNRFLRNFFLKFVEEYHISTHH